MERLTDEEDVVVRQRHLGVWSACNAMQRTLVPKTTIPKRDGGSC